MSKTNFDIAAEIMVAALQAGAWKPAGSTPQSQAESIGEAYAIILAAARRASDQAH